MAFFFSFSPLSLSRHSSVWTLETGKLYSRFSISYIIIHVSPDRRVSCHIVANKANTMLNNTNDYPRIVSGLMKCQKTSFSNFLVLICSCCSLWSRQIFQLRGFLNAMFVVLRLLFITLFHLLLIVLLAGLELFLHFAFLVYHVNCACIYRQGLKRLLKC